MFYLGTGEVRFALVVKVPESLASNRKDWGRPPSNPAEQRTVRDVKDTFVTVQLWTWSGRPVN